MLKYILVATCVFAISLMAMADTIILKDGSKLEGTVIGKIGREYRIKTADGTVHKIAEVNVKQIIKGNAPGGAAPGGPAPGIGKPTSPPKPTGGAPAPSPAATPDVPSATPAAKGTSAAFAATKAKADRVEAPIAAVSIWEKFIDTKPGHADLEAANAELVKWQALQKDNAEKINGKWVGGEERKKLIQKAKDTVREAAKLEDGNMIKAISKYEEAIRLYPNSFEAHFRLGYINLVKGGPAKYDAAIKSLEQAVRIDEQSPEALTNLAVAYSLRKRHEQAVLMAHRAVRVEDSKELVENLLACFNYAPIGMQRNNQKMRPIMEEARVLASKHNIGGPPSGYHYLPPGYSDAKRVAEGKPPVEKDTGGPPGIVGNGSGFLISEDGYVITNRHVVNSGEGHYYRVRFEDGTEKNAEVIAVNDKADCALLKIKSDSPLPYLRIADANPNPAAKALVLGYPATGTENMVMQVSSGDVASVNPGDEHEVWYHLSTTHGNSGGPIVDKNARVIGILTGGRQVHNVTYVLGVGPMQIKSFLETLGEKAPKIEYAPPGEGEFDGEKLAAEARKSTLLVLIVRGDNKDAAPAAAPAAGEEGDSPAPADGAGAAGAAGAGAGAGTAK